MLWHIQNGSFSLLEAQGDFSPVFTVRIRTAPGGNTHKIVDFFCRSITEFPFGVSTLRVIHTWASSNWSITVQVSLSWQWFPWKLLLLDFCSGNLEFFVFASLSFQFGGQPFGLWPHFLYGSKRFFSSVLSLLWGQSGDFQAFHMPDQKKEVLHFLFVA